MEGYYGKKKKILKTYVGKLRIHEIKFIQVLWLKNRKRVKHKREK